MKKNLLSTLLEAVQSGAPVVLATLTRGAEHEIGAQLLFRNDGCVLGESEDASFVASAQAHAQKMFGQERTETVRVGEREFFLESYCPAPKLIIVGAVHIAIPLVTFAKELGYKVILVDPRRAFATPERFPHVDELVTRWPDAALAEIGVDASTCLVVLTHDPKLDDPAVTIALQHAPAYLGVLGSRKTHEQRLQRLREQGLSETQLARLHAPVGMAIGARTPAEIALSIMAEIIAIRRGAMPNA